MGRGAWEGPCKGGASADVATENTGSAGWVCQSVPGIWSVYGEISGQLVN